MQKKIIWIVVSFLVVLSMALLSCTVETSTTITTTTTTTVTKTQQAQTTVTTEPSKTTTTSTVPKANWWDKLGEPQYGETVTLRSSTIDPGDVHARMGFSYAYGEVVFYYNWTTDREEYAFNTNFVPMEYIVGVLAESWELADPATLTVHVRQGVHFQDRPPVNGRELTADDIACHFDWILGTGHGYTQPIPQAPSFSDTESVNAVDKYTVVFHFKPPGGYRAIAQVIFAGETGKIVPIEVEQAGLAFEWDAVNSTGPFIVSDYQSNSSLTLSRNPNYWGYDERHPQNQLPYIDGIKLLAIPDMATAMAAMRTGKLDWLEDRSLNWIQAQSIQETNPEMQVSYVPNMGVDLDMRCDHEPFTNINVRKAMNMALDRQAIAKSHYGGIVDGTPAGLIAPESGWTTLYKDWPKELQEEYSYNPERAKQLLADAGYPNGFETNVYASTDDDMDLLQIMKSYFMDIGVDMTINTMDPVTFRTFGQTKKHDQMITMDVCAMIFTPPIILSMRSQYFDPNKTCNNDPKWEAYVESVGSLNAEEAKALCIEADLYLLSQHWAVQLFGTRQPVINQPWVKGYSGERADIPYYWARFWINK